MCGVDEEWEHVILCKNNEENREEWTKCLENKMKEPEKCGCVEEEEK